MWVGSGPAISNNSIVLRDPEQEEQAPKATIAAPKVKMEKAKGKRKMGNEMGGKIGAACAGEEKQEDAVMCQYLCSSNGWFGKRKVCTRRLGWIMKVNEREEKETAATTFIRR